MVLADKYGATYEEGPSVKCWISLRYPPYSQPLFVNHSGDFFDGRLTVTPRGSLISLWLFTNFWRTPLLVPWEDLEVIGRRGHFEFDVGCVLVTFAKVPNIRMRISGDAIHALMKVGAPWQISAEGHVVMQSAETAPMEKI